MKFDIVIGNPPYVSAETQFTDKSLLYQRRYLESCNKYKSLHYKWDLYIPFVELSLCLLNINGICSLIVPFSITNQRYSEYIRNIIIKEYDLFKIVDLNGNKIFNTATVNNCILFIEKTIPKNNIIILNNATALFKFEECYPFEECFDATKENILLFEDRINRVFNDLKEMNLIVLHLDFVFSYDIELLNRIKKEVKKLNKIKRIKRAFKNGR